ncbi:MAG: cytosolic protein, partial [Candidatus Glassbacteria bacterium]|nr:cytosolic protein [Candidatus Glassbacteria bacterium]
KQESDFQNAVTILRQTKHTINVLPVLGICYGKTKTKHMRGYMKVVGQNFWYLISNNKSLYIDIIEPLGFEAKKHNDTFIEKKDAIINILSNELIENFCDNGRINWKKLVEYNSGNLDLD